MDTNQKVIAANPAARLANQVMRSANFSLARDAVPEAYTEAQREESIADLTSDMVWECLKRFGPTLEILGLLAEGSAKSYSSHVKRGGRDAETSRTYLFGSLVGEYEALFGISPAGASPSIKNDSRQTRPAGRDLRWFTALLKLVADKADEQSRLDKEAAHDQDAADRIILLDRLLQLASGQKGRGHGQGDALVHWIRLGKRNWKMRRGRQGSSAPD